MIGSPSQVDLRPNDRKASSDTTGRPVQQLVSLPRPGQLGTNAPTRHLHSNARMVGFSWVVTSVERPEIVTVGQWLDSVVREHRDALAEPTAVLTVEYEPLSRALQQQLAEVRRLDSTIRRTRTALEKLDRQRRSAREAIVRALSAAGLLPSEIESITGLPLATVVAIVGSEQESRIARELLRKTRSR